MLLSSGLWFPNLNGDHGVNAIGEVVLGFLSGGLRCTLATSQTNFP